MISKTAIKTEAYDLGPAFDPGASVFVSANAGSGKTSLLTARVLRLLLHGVSPSKILCLTYTNAAAGEMANRVLAQLGTWVMADSAVLVAQVQPLLGRRPDDAMLRRARGLFAKVLEAPEGLRIQTLHGFCQSLLKRFPIEAGVSPHFSVMDSRTEQELLYEARMRLFNRASEGDTQLQQSLRNLAHMLSEGSFNTLLSEIVGKKRKFAALFRRAGGASSAVEDVWKFLGVKADTTFESLLKTHLTYDDQTLKDLRSACARLLECESKTDVDTGRALAQWLERQDDAPAYVKAYFTEKNTPRKQIFTKAFKDTYLAECLLAERARVIEYHQATCALSIARHSTDMLHIAHALLDLYENIKQAHARMDYDDLILSACDLLARDKIAPWVLFKLDGGIDHILVDEAQDTSAEQWSIIDALTGEFFSGTGRTEIERSLFVVGDEKQSIFSFQGADPIMLGQKQTDFKARISAAAMRVNTMELTQSFRSTPEVLTAVDSIFAQPQARAGLMFADNALEHFPTKSHAGLVELWPLIKPEGDGSSATSLLAKQIADTIAGWIRAGSTRPGDIMILVRSRTTLVDKLTRALKKRGVPVAGNDRMELGENLAVQDLIALGQCVLLPEDDLTLAALLKSPIFNVSEEALFNLAYARDKQSLWERLRTQPQLADALALLEDLRARADFVRPYELYSYVLDTLGARRRFTGRMGEEYSDPIDEFLNQALLYEDAHPPSLQGFIHWLTRSQSEIKRDMEQAHQSVRIMTVHGAKGLQAPIVILPDTTQPPKPKGELLWHEGLPLKAISTSQLDSRSGALYEVAKDNMLAEYRRLLYVALTRAEDRLYICGALSRGKTASEESWYHHIQQGLVPIAETFEINGEQGLRLGTPIARPAAIVQEASPSRQGKDMAFLRKAAPLEPAPPQPLAPSRLEGEEPASNSPLRDSSIYRRGNLIHALMQHLPDMAPDKRALSAQTLAQLRGQGLSKEEQAAAIAETLAVIDDPKFAFIFSQGSLAEVPIAGCVEYLGKIVAVSGQIDRLYIGKDEVWIVDYKSNRTPPARIPTAYHRQLTLYRLVLQAIYPTKRIRCALLWTAVPAITTLDEGQLGS